jgi:hypothetical protein
MRLDGGAADDDELHVVIDENLQERFALGVDRRGHATGVWWLGGFRANRASRPAANELRRDMNAGLRPRSGARSDARPFRARVLELGSAGLHFVGGLTLMVARCCM